MRALVEIGFGLGCLLAVAGCGSDDDGSSTSGGSGGGVDNPVPFENGWAPLDQNSAGIQGAFYVFNDNDDGGGSAITPTTGSDGSFSMAGTTVCASGTAGQVMNDSAGSPDYSSYWGAAIGLNLSQEVGMDAALPYNASTQGVTGFEFIVGGDNPIPAGGELRFNIKVNGDDNNYCRKINQPGLNTFKLTDMWQSCWENDASAPTPDPSKLEALHWQYVTNTSASYDFHLCIEALGVLK